MEIFGGLVEAIPQFAELGFLLAFAIGVLNGMLFGALPGLSGSVGIALMIPLTFGMGASQAMALFVGALAAQTFAGSITAILINTPGTAPNAATTFDGYPLARAGRGGFALGISATSSALGSLIGVLLLVALFPAVRSIILAVSFPEFTMLGVMGLTVIAVASRGSLFKGIISGAFGLIISFVGFSPIGGDLRYLFGMPQLYAGVNVIAVLIGVFALSEVMRLLVSNQAIARGQGTLSVSRRQVWEGVLYTLKQPFLVLRSSLLGTAVGIVPAVGGTVASFLAYFQASKTSRNSGSFGRGDPRGVLAPEAANNCKDAGAALPTLAFGIPGSADWAIILGAMILHGLTPGPNMMREQPDVIWVAVLVILAAGWASCLIGLAFAPHLVQVTRVRATLLAPVVAVLAIVGSYGLDRQLFTVYIAIAFGIIGYVMRRVSMPVIPLILGLILGETVERGFLQTLSIFGGPSAFVTRPISLVLVLITVGIIILEVVSSQRERRREGPAAAAVLAESIRPASLAVVATFGAIGVLAVVQAAGFASESSRTFPLIAGWLLITVVALYLVIALIRPLRDRLGAIIADSGGLEKMGPRAVREDRVDAWQAQDEPEPNRGADEEAMIEVREAPSEPAREDNADEENTRKVWLVSALLVAFCVVAYLVGLVVAVPLLLVALFRYVGKESWKMLTIVSAVTLLFLYFVFVEILRIPIEGGLLLPI